MAALRSQLPAVGSARWILAERRQANQLIDQDVEDFGFSVQNEVEWLNEHMADIFARNQLYVELLQPPPESTHIRVDH